MKYDLKDLSFAPEYVRSLVRKHSEKLYEDVGSPKFNIDFRKFPKIKTLNTAAGASFPNKRKSEVILAAHNNAQYIKHGVKLGHKLYKIPCMMGFRGHLSKKEEMKVRPVWIYPFEIIQLESVFTH